MVLTLENICLLYLTQNFSQVKDVGSYLPRVHLELLVQRLSNQGKFTDKLLPSITNELFSHKLKEITWTYNEQITDKVLAALASCGCQLIKLKLVGLKNVTDKGFLSIGKHQKNLRTLVLKNLKSITDKALSTLQCPSLLKVKIVKCHIGDLGVTKLVKQNPNISKLSIARTEVADKGLTAVAKCLNKSLRSLDLTGLRALTDEGFIALGNEQCENLEVLLLNCCSKVTGTGLKQVCIGCPNLTVLDVGYCFDIGHDNGRSSSVEIFPNKLRELSLHGVSIRESLLIDLTNNVPSISCLRLCGVDSVNEHLLDQICSSVGANLIELDLSGCRDLLDSSLSAVSRHCTSLQVLAFSLCNNITGATLIPWLKKRGHLLRKFHASGCTKLSRATLDQVVLSCPNLENLTITCSPFVDDDFLIMLSSNCRNIQYLNIKACKQVTDLGTCAVMASCRLRDLVLSGISKLTDQTICTLASTCPDTLSSLFISGCYKITSAGTNHLLACCLNKVWVERRVPESGTDTGDR